MERGLRCYRHKCPFPWKCEAKRRRIRFVYNFWLECTATHILWDIHCGVTSSAKRAGARQSCCGPFHKERGTLPLSCVATRRVKSRGGVSQRLPLDCVYQFLLLGMHRSLCANRSPYQQGREIGPSSLSTCAPSRPLSTQTSISVPLRFPVLTPLVPQTSPFTFISK